MRPDNDTCLVIIIGVVENESLVDISSAIRHGRFVRPDSALPNDIKIRLYGTALEAAEN